MQQILWVLPAMLLALWAQWRVKSSFAMAAERSSRSGQSGAEVAYEILRSAGLERSVGIETTDGMLGDHYDPQKKVLRLSPDVYHGRNLAALGVAAHEVGHALQDAKRYPLLGIRNAIVPLASFGSSAAMFLIMIGLLIGSAGLFLLGILGFSMVVLFQIVNLPVEYDASRRAKEILVQRGYLSQAELPYVEKMLSAAALTYVAATLSAVLNLLYYISMLQSDRRE